MSDTFTEYRLSFFDETDEHLSLMDDSLIAFEKNPSDTLPVDRIFRVLHTLKSSAAAVGYDGLSDLAHRAEDLIDGLRSGKPAVRASALETLFNAVDSIRAYVEAAKRGGESAVSFDAVRAEIDRFRGGRRERKSVKGRGKSPSGTPDPAAATEYERALLRETLRKGKACYEIRIEIDSAEPTKWLRAELVLNHVRATGRILRVSPPRDAFMKDGFDGRFLLWVAAELPPAEIRNRVSVDLLKRLDVVPLRKSAAEAAPAVPDKPLSEPFEKREGASTGSASSAPSSVNTVRVPVHKLDGLLHLIGELVIANSGMKLLENRLREKYHDDLIKGDMSLLNDQLMKISLGLQTDVLNMRMLPIGTVFGAFHRIVRDLSKQEGKDVNLAVSGMDTELDKKIIDAIGEPLMHLVRNAVDHGIEPPDERARAGKPATGTITLSASQSGNRILVSVRDDGRGVDPAVIRRKAAETGLVTREQAAGMSDDEALEFIFEHGFSTSERVDAVSGRGVGLDVVKNAIERLNGSVHVLSRRGQGSEFLITLPLTLAILTVIVVESAGEAYAIPIGDIRETIKVDSGLLEARGVVPAVSWQDEVVPVTRLEDVFPGSRPDGSGPEKPGRVPVVVVSVRDGRIGLAVDRIGGKHEVVLKPLETHYRSVKGLSGAALLGDGSVVLVVDVMEIWNQLKAASGRHPAGAGGLGKPGPSPVIPKRRES